MGGRRQIHGCFMKEVGNIAIHQCCHGGRAGGDLLDALLDVLPMVVVVLEEDAIF